MLRGTAKPELLHTYSEERQSVAHELIDFDREFSGLFSARARTTTERDSALPDPEQFQQYFVAQGRFTAGVATRYAPSMITAEPTFQHLAEGFPIGMRFHSTPVVRLADVKPLHLGQSPAPTARGVSISSPTSTTRPATNRGPGSCASSWPRTRHRSAGSPPRAPSATP